MTDRHSRWMAISGMPGLIFFVIANFTNVFVTSKVLAGCLQLCFNALVFVFWYRAYSQRTGFKKLFASCGVFIPPMLATITIWRVLIPAFVRWYGANAAP